MPEEEKVRAYVGENRHLAFVYAIEDIYAARTDEMNDMDILLQTESTILLKNEDNILPLSEGTKVYITGDDENLLELDIDAFGAYAEVTEDIEDADVVIIRAADGDIIAEAIEEAQDEEKPIILAVQAGNGSDEPTSYMAENCAGLLMLTYNNTPDHGSTIAGVYINHYTLSSTLAEMIFGVREPSGSLLYEIARTDADASLDWGELAVDTGVSMQTRLYMAATMRQDPTTTLPTNLGDVLYPSDFGMRYGEDADIDLNTLVAKHTFVHSYPLFINVRWTNRSCAALHPHDRRHSHTHFLYLPQKHSPLRRHSMVKYQRLLRRTIL